LSSQLLECCAAAAMIAQYVPWGASVLTRMATLLPITETLHGHIVACHDDTTCFIRALLIAYDLC